MALLGVKDLLLSHLDKEDTRLYPMLLQSTTGNTRLIAQTYIDDMQATSQMVFDFFEKYSHDDIANIQELDTSFVVDITNVIKKLRLRIGREEKFLYPLAQAEIDQA